MKEYLKKLFCFEPPSEKKDFILTESDKEIDYDIRTEAEPPSPQAISRDIEKNLSYINSRFSIPKNDDFVIRHILMKNNRKAFVLFIDGMTDSDKINEGVIKPLLEIPYFTDDDISKCGDEICERFIAHSQTKSVNDMDKMAEGVNFGNCAVFIDGLDRCFVLDVKKWATRGIEKPEVEQSIYGPQEAFAEMLRSNTVLIRKFLKTEKLIAEGVKVGTVSKTPGVLLYISDIANQALVSEARRRINGISMDYVIAIEEIEMMIEESSYKITSQIIETERPDRVSKALTEGKVALLLNGSSKALIFPSSIFDFNHTASDYYMRIPYANVSRVIRLITTFASLLLPGVYLAVTLFHQEVIPTYLLYSISASRENVPFPSLFELIIMDISFEMISEAGIRMPGAIGSTLGIVGGLILGQAAVSAKIVSPIMIIIIAITGIGSFASTNYSMGWSFRILRFIFILLGASMGFYGIAAGIVVYALMLGAMKSFGTPFLAPMPKPQSRNVSNSIFVNPIWKREKRPSYLHTQNDKAEPKISRKK